MYWVKDVCPCVHKTCILYKNRVYFVLEIKVGWCFFYQKCVFFKYCFILQTWAKIQRNMSICSHPGQAWLIVLHILWVWLQRPQPSAQLCLQIWKQNCPSLDPGHTNPATCWLYCICLSLCFRFMNFTSEKNIYLSYHFLISNADV